MRGCSQRSGISRNAFRLRLEERARKRGLGAIPVLATDAKYRAQYKRRLRYAVLVTVPLFVLLFYFYPKVEFKPYVPPYEPPMEIVVPDELIVPEMPREIRQPVIPVEVSSGEGEVEDDIDIPENVFSSIDDMPALPGGGDEGGGEPIFYAFDEAPVLIQSIKPVYPEIARQVGIEGTVLLRLLVVEDGTVREVAVIQSNVTPAMEEAAILAARQYKFRPAKQRNIPVKAHVAIPIIFKIN